ncbi:MAG: zinc ribbon domain-containing protein [Clostridia bacterium]|nr:zinc ribbon domain-containing protein [Clostridia bacterium]
MFCQQCGHQVNEGVAFCPICGEPMQQNNTTQEVVVSSNRRLWKILIPAIGGTLLILILVLVLSLSSGSVEDQLVGEKWYYDTVELYFGQYSSGAIEVLEFHENNEAELEYYVLSGDEWYCKSDSSPSWELLEDNTLHFRGNYYEWETEWHIDGDELTIGSTVYTSDKPDTLDFDEQ